MKIAPLDLRKAKFGSAVRGFNRAEVTNVLHEAADGYEQAIRETDRLQHEVTGLQTQLKEHREREGALRDTPLAAQRLAAEVRERAKEEAQLIVRETRGLAEEIVRASQARCDEMKHEIGELGHKRIDVETTVEASIAALRNALDFVRKQDRQHPQTSNLRPHRPRIMSGADTAPGPTRLATRTASPAPTAPGQVSRPPQPA